MDFHLEVMVNFATIKIWVIKGLNCVGTECIPILSMASCGDGKIIRPVTLAINENTVFQKLLTPLHFQKISEMPSLSPHLLKQLEDESG